MVLSRSWNRERTVPVMTPEVGNAPIGSDSEQILVTTSLEDSWPNGGEQVLFLGQWCCRFSRRKLLADLSYQVAPYHWDARDKLAEDYRYLAGLYERVLLNLHDCLNETHGVDHGIKYWRMVIGPWLWRYVHVVFDRFEMIRTAEAMNFDASIVLDGAFSLPPPDDTVHFNESLGSDVWNHALFARLLSQRGFGDRLRPGPPVMELTRTDDQRSPSKPLVRRLFDQYNAVALRAARENDVVMYQTYLDPREELRLGMMLGQVPCIRPALRRIDRRIPANRDQSAALTLDLPTGVPFESMIAEEIGQDLPVAFLEGFQQLDDIAADLPWPSNPRVIWTSNAHYSGDVFNVWAADKVERGVPLILGQHGGFFGTAALSPSEDHERNVSDVSLTWGWVNSDGHRYEPVGQFPAVQPLKGGFSERPNAVLVSHVMTRCAKEASASIISSQWLEYFDFQSQFIESLPEYVRKTLVVRTVSNDLGWDQVERWESRHPNVKVDAGERPLLKLVEDCRLYVATANSTTFLQAFHLGIPTILLWDPVHWELRDSADGAFRALESASVYHPDPVRAAEFIGEIWTDTDAWWRSAEVQSAVNGFNDQFNRCPPDLLYQIREVIRRTADAVPHNKNCRR